MKIRKLICILAALAMLFSLSACHVTAKVTLPEKEVEPEITDDTPIENETEELGWDANLEEPPEMRLLFEGEERKLTLSTYEWNWAGYSQGVCADYPHPLDIIPDITELDGEETKVQLKCDWEFSSPRVQCWGTGLAGDMAWNMPNGVDEVPPHAYPEPEELPVNSDFSFELKDGSYVYCVTVDFELGASGGTVCYVFFAQTGDMVVCF